MVNPSSKLNLRRLPTQTTLLFAVLTSVVGFTFLAPAFPNSSYSPTALGLASVWLWLALRDFLRTPDQEIARHKLQAVEQSGFPAVQSEIERLSKDRGLRPPKLWQAQEPGIFFAFGTFTRQGLAVGAAQLQRLEKDLGSLSPSHRVWAQAALLHELQHLQLRDVIWVGLARSLLKSAVALSIWAIIFWLGFVIAILGRPLRDFASPEFINRVTQIQPIAGSLFNEMLTPEFKASLMQPPAWFNVATYFVSGQLAILAGAGLLYLTLWRRLLQVREYYADATAAEALGSRQPLVRALAICGAVAQIKTVDQAPDVKQPLPQPMAFTRVQPARAVNWRDRLQRTFDSHPTRQLRQRALDYPEEALGSPVWIGLTAGLMVTFIDFSLAGPYTVLSWASHPGLTAVVIGFLAMALWLTPRLMFKPHKWRTWIKASAQVIGLILLWRTGADVLNLALFGGIALFSPGQAAEIYTLWVGSAARVFSPPGNLFGGAELMIFALRAAVAVVLLAFLIVVGIGLGSLADYGLKRLTLTWYGLRSPEKLLPLAWWGVTVMVVIALGGVFLPLVVLPINLLMGIEAWNWGWLLGVMSAAFIVCVGLLIFGAVHLQKGGRCSRGHRVPGAYTLGQSCPECGETLHPWLLVNY